MNRAAQGASCSRASFKQADALQGAFQSRRHRKTDTLHTAEAGWHRATLLTCTHLLDINTPAKLRQLEGKTV